MQILKSQNFLVFALMTLCSVHIYGLYYRAGEYFYDIIDAVFYLTIFLFLLALFRSRNNRITLSSDEKIISIAISLIFIGVILSSFSGFVLHNQNPFLSILASRNFAYFVLFFVLCITRIDQPSLIKLILIVALGYALTYSAQVIFYPVKIVPFGSVDSIDRGFLRIRVEGVGFLTFSGFYFLHRFKFKPKKIYIAGYLFCLAYVIALGFRTLTVAYIVFSMLMLFDSAKMYKKAIIALFIAGGIYTALEIDPIRQFYELTISKTAEQVNMGSDYIRARTFDFLFNQVNEGLAGLVFGNSRPFLGTEYGNLVLGKGANQYGFIAADLGLIGFSFYYGLLTTLVFCYLFLRVIAKSNTKKLALFRYYFLYLLTSSFTTAEIFRPGMFGLETIVLYLFCIERTKKSYE